MENATKKNPRHIKNAFQKLNKIKRKDNSETDFLFLKYLQLRLTPMPLCTIQQNIDLIFSKLTEIQIYRNVYMNKIHINRLRQIERKKIGLQERGRKQDRYEQTQKER